MQTVLPALGAAVLVGVFALPAGGQLPEPPRGTPPERAQVDANPCIGPQAAQLRCPDLVMRRPYGLYTDRLTKAGSTVLRAGNVIDSVGAGPVELRGERATLAHDVGLPAHPQPRRGIVSVDTDARLQFKFAHQQRYWWKFHDAARFELWRVDSAAGARSWCARGRRSPTACATSLARVRASPARRAARSTRPAARIPRRRA